MISEQEEQLNVQFTGKSLRAQERAYIRGIVEDVLQQQGLIKKQGTDWEQIMGGAK